MEDERTAAAVSVFVNGGARLGFSWGCRTVRGIFRRPSLLDTDEGKSCQAHGKEQRSKGCSHEGEGFFDG
ncbi:hypothetical protein [uncultured Adlercreutzia sp.]|uniref:hypothetical protein n=1 Tax=uncultured Adlercreutzia sp. TaxID=875803 RepID=UPI0025FA2351|nr:hypothetical protein [uncultured Adlercreutzia sp.]